MKNHILLIIFLCLNFMTSCEKEKEEIIKPNIIFESPSDTNFLIGKSILVTISVNHNEALDNIKYYEILNCSDDNYDSLNLTEWEDVYELSWSYEKSIETNYFPEDITCTCTIQVEATDLNNIMNQTEILINISDDFSDE